MLFVCYKPPFVIWAADMLTFSSTMDGYSRLLASCGVCTPAILCRLFMLRQAALLAAALGNSANYAAPPS